MQKTTSIQSKTVCHISFNHSALDDRIYWKELISLKEAGFEVVHVCVGKEEVEYITSGGIRIIQMKKRVFFKNMWLNRITQFFLWKKTTLYHIFQKASLLSAAIYHYHDLQLNALALKLKKLPHKPKLIYDAHEAYHLLFEEQIPKKIVSKCLYKLFILYARKWELKKASFADVIITTDRYTQSYFKASLPAIPVITIFNYSFFNNSLEANILPKKFDFIYTGTISEKRGVFDIIEAISFFKKEIKPIVLLIGTFETPSLKTVVRNKIQALKLENNIIIHESVPFSEIGYFYKNSSVGLCLLHNTKKYSTAIAIKIFEYFSFGLPVIATDVGPSADYVKEANAGLIVSSNDVKSIYKAMEYLLVNRESFLAFSVNGITAVNAKFSWDKEKDKLLSVYNRLIQNKYE